VQVGAACAEFAKGVSACCSGWWGGKYSNSKLAARMLVGIKSDVITLDILRLSISTVFGKSNIVTFAARMLVAVMPAVRPMTSFILLTRSVRAPCFKVVSLTM
jgi:hypothetical protein